MSLELTGKFGLPTDLGNMWCGFSEIGDDNPFSGVYQRRKRKGGQIIVKMVYSMPPYVNTTIQKARRTKFSDAIKAWNELPFEQQVIWNKKKSPRGMSGYNRFISFYMLH